MFTPWELQHTQHSRLNTHLLSCENLTHHSQQESYHPSRTLLPQLETRSNPELYIALTTQPVTSPMMHWNLHPSFVLNALFSPVLSTLPLLSPVPGAWGQGGSYLPKTPRDTEYIIEIFVFNKQRQQTKLKGWMFQAKAFPYYLLPHSGHLSLSRTRSSMKSFCPLWVF